MSFALPSVKPRPEVQDFVRSTGAYGVADLMTDGLKAAKKDPAAPHPVMLSEMQYAKNRDIMNLAILRNTQGLHAPLRIQMELSSAKKVGRLPFLTSSNAIHDALTGRDVELGPEDVFGSPEFYEYGGQPHAVVERSLGLL